MRCCVSLSHADIQMPPCRVHTVAVAFACRAPSAAACSSRIRPNSRTSSHAHFSKADSQLIVPPSSCRRVPCVHFQIPAQYRSSRHRLRTTVGHVHAPSAIRHLSSREPSKASRRTPKFLCKTEEDPARIPESQEMPRREARTNKHTKREDEAKTAPEQTMLQAASTREVRPTQTEARPTIGAWRRPAQRLRPVTAAAHRSLISRLW